jgi:hypothetical protein
MFMSDEKKKKEQEEQDSMVEEAQQRELQLTCGSCHIKYSVMDSSDCPECGFDNSEQMEEELA